MVGVKKIIRPWPLFFDASERKTKFEYDAYGKLIQTSYHDDTKSTSSYDTQGNLLSVTNIAGQTTSYEYDKLDRQTKVTNPDGSTTQTEYDANGRVIAQIGKNGSRVEGVRGAVLGCRNSLLIYITVPHFLDFHLD